MVLHRWLIFTAALTMSAVPGRAQLVKPRSIEPGRIIAAGEFPAASAALVKPRTIEPGRIIAAGEFPAVVAVKPRTIALNGIVAVGLNAPAIAPRTIRLTGWTASQPRGGKK
jgi:hypothetical protein